MQVLEYSWHLWMDDIAFTWTEITESVCVSCFTNIVFRVINRIQLHCCSLYDVVVILWSRNLNLTNQPWLSLLTWWPPGGQHQPLPNNRSSTLSPNTLPITSHKEHRDGNTHINVTWRESNRSFTVGIKRLRLLKLYFTLLVKCGYCHFSVCTDWLV